MKVIFSELSNRDLEKIGDWIANENPHRAYLLIRELRLDCASLADFPMRHAIYTSNSLGNIRRKVSGNFIIFYIVELEVVSIVRILHGAQDYADLF